MKHGNGKQLATESKWESAAQIDEGATDADEVCYKVNSWRAHTA
jgi:hypothetical protein